MYDDLVGKDELVDRLLESFAGFFSFLKSNPDFTRTVAEQFTTSRYFSNARDDEAEALKVHLEAELRYRFLTRANEEVDRTARYMVGGNTALINAWINSDMQEGIESLSRFHALTTLWAACGLWDEAIDPIHLVAAHRWRWSGDRQPLAMAAPRSTSFPSAPPSQQLAIQ